MLLHPAGSKYWRSQHFHAVFGHEISHGVGTLFVHPHFPDFVKKLLKWSGTRQCVELKNGARPCAIFA
jgi:hypothetical protein